MANAEVVSIKGLIPAIDARRISEPYAVDGNNFYIGIDGPVTGFSREVYANKFVHDGRYAQTFSVDNLDASLIFTADAVISIDGATKEPLILYRLDNTSPEYFWTRAFVGGVHYFAKRGFGLLSYNVADGAWGKVDGVQLGESVPEGIISCAAAGGRLVVAAPGVVAWSSIDSGADFTTSTATGAGFQSLGVVNSFTADSIIGVYSVADGVVTFTRNGILRSQLTDSVTTFRHERVDTYYYPINSRCITEFGDGRLVYLTQQGLYEIAPDGPQVFEALMGEYFRTKLLPKVKLVDEGMFALEYLHTPEWLFLSVAEEADFGLFTKAYVWSSRSKEWGAFNRKHTAVVDFYIDNPIEYGLNVGYIDNYGTLFKFNAATADLVAPEWVSGYVQWKNTPALISQKVGGVVQAVVESTGDEFLPAAVQSGYYSYSSGLGVPYVTAPLDAYVTVGPFRMREGEAVLEYAHVVTVMIGTTSTSAVSSLYDDWLLGYGDEEVVEDYMLVSPEVVDDYMAELGDSAAVDENDSNYVATVHASIDGVRQIPGVPTTLSTIAEESRSTIFAADATGVYFSVTLSAAINGHSFQLKNIELQGNSAGRFV